MATRFEGEPNVGVRGNLVTLDVPGIASMTTTTEGSRNLARLLVQMADIIDPPKKEEPPKDPAPAATEEKP
jgi:hypothetical protein